MFHLITSILAIRNSIADSVLLHTTPILADKLVEAAMHVATLLVFPLRAVVALVASSFRRNTLPVVALVAFGPAGEPSVRAVFRLVRSVPAVNPFVAELLPVNATSSPIATKLIVRTSRAALLVAHVTAVDGSVASLPGGQAEAGGGAVEAVAGAVPLVRPVGTLSVPVALDSLAHTGAISALVTTLGADSLSIAPGDAIVLFVAHLAIIKGRYNLHTEESVSGKADDLKQSWTSHFKAASP